jgi:hypothetical protein
MRVKAMRLYFKRHDLDAMVIPLERNHLRVAVSQKKACAVIASRVESNSIASSS